MPRRTISLDAETYDRLRREKTDDESFSDVIDRLLGDEEPLADLVGLVTDAEADRVRAHSDQFREDVTDRFDRVDP
ncbi:antitoxin VapB family protein [Halococcoides cellulosivorans]|uniref:Antitoxin n=1 Tax=Halococcoides cellulosivorans TaxID=1679096 RepID=A0A2R4WZR3_9EURY|nr:antitoxin VapB family protein [Halococcoides cellulosivorans]AWB27020.1 hypothetical protein HARCEL1_04500 [Halococcoides cellulosivorans]